MLSQVAVLFIAEILASENLDPIFQTLNDCLLLDWCTYHDHSYCNNGACNNVTQNCDCEPNFYGSTCDTYCLANTTCSGRGSCSNDGSCACNANWYGKVRNSSLHTKLLLNNESIVRPDLGDRDSLLQFFFNFNRYIASSFNPIYCPELQHILRSSDHVLQTWNLLQRHWHL